MEKGFLVRLTTLPIDLDNYSYTNFTCQGFKRTQAIMVLTGLTWDSHPQPLPRDFSSAQSRAATLCPSDGVGVLVSSSWVLLIQTLTHGLTSDLPDHHKHVGDLDYGLPPALPLLQPALLPVWGWWDQLWLVMSCPVGLGSPPGSQSTLPVP